MSGSNRTVLAAAFMTAIAFLFLGGSKAWAHCDGLDGPVVSAAREALAAEEVGRVLIWVQKDQEAEVRRAFGQALSVRKAGPEARELADRWFFETLVRLHRAGEGAPYTGLKPAGRDLGAAVPAADRALRSGNPGPLQELVMDAVREGLDRQFAQAMQKKEEQEARPGDVEAGRGFVEAYVEYVHWVERIYEATGDAAHGEVAAAGHVD